MPLFQIQDDDRPCFIFAKDFGDALKKYKEAVARDNDGEDFDPVGIICLEDSNHNIIIGDYWVDPL